MKRPSISTTRLLWMLAVICIACVVLSIEWAPSDAQRILRRTERESTSRLASAGSMDELEQAGLVLRVGDTGWLAIRYVDSHSAVSDGFFGPARMISSAVARTSDGRWLRSRVHYCALFSAYRASREDLNDASSAGPEFAEMLKSTEEWFHQDDQSHLSAAEHAASMDQAVGELEAIGFEEFRPGVTVMQVQQRGERDGANGGR